MGPVTSLTSSFSGRAISVAVSGVSFFGEEMVSTLEGNVEAESTVCRSFIIVDKHGQVSVVR